MSKKQWFLLWLIFISYLFFGATVFYYLERRLELERRHIVRGEQEEIEDLLRMNYASDAPEAQEQILLRLTEYCGKPFSTKKSFTLRNNNSTVIGSNSTVSSNSLINSNSTQNSTDSFCDDNDDDTCEDENPIRWTFYNSFFFALTTLSTIGYGNLSPTSMEGRLLVIFYSLIGIPLNGIVLSQLGECFGSTFMRVHHRYKTHRFETKLNLIMDIIMYLVPGVVFFIFIPSGFFVYFEGWTFDESIYYAFVTLTTIGYGDFVAGQTGSENPWYNIYKVLLIIWFMFGLGYLVMILGFIARAMQSKKIARLEQAVTQTLKHTQNKIWKEFTHEVTVVRRALNEMYLLKVKPVYRDGAEVGPLLGTKRLSRSAPQLSEWPVLRRREPQQESSEDLEAEEDLEAAFRAKRLQRRQAFSENVLKARPQRTASDGNLTLIDRTATFRSTTPVEPGLLLARIVDAIGTPIPARGHDSGSDSESEDFKPPKFNGYGDGINMFSDSDILASEWGGSERDRNRSRTLSEDLFPPPYHITDYDEQRTWSGNEYNYYKNDLSHEPMPGKDGWSQSDQLLAPARGLRRMSMAAINFFTPAARWVKRSSLQKSSPDINQQQQQAKVSREWKTSSHAKPARTRQHGINRHASDGYLKKHRYSLQDNSNSRRCEDEHPKDDSVNHLSYTTGRRPSLLAALAREMGPKPDSTSSISPVLEQTSVADFIRVLSTLHDRQDHDGDHNLTICNGDTSRHTSRRLFRSTSTLDSYQRAEAVNPSLVTSEAAFGPPPATSDVRRRRFSFVPTLSSFSTNENRPTKKLSTEGLFQQRRSRSQSVSPVDSSLSLAAMPAPVDRRIRRMSSSGSKDRSIPGRRSFSLMTSHTRSPPTPRPLLKNLTPPRLVITSPDGHEQNAEHSRFTVSQPDPSVVLPKLDHPDTGSNQQSSAVNVTWTSSPPQDDNPERKDSLTDVVVVKL